MFQTFLQLFNGSGGEQTEAVVLVRVSFLTQRLTRQSRAQVHAFPSLRLLKGLSTINNQGPVDTRKGRRQTARRRLQVSTDFRFY